MKKTSLIIYLALCCIIIGILIIKSKTITNLEKTLHEKEQLLIKQNADIQILQDQNSTYLKYWMDCQEFRKIDSLLYESLISSKYNMP